MRLRGGAAVTAIVSMVYASTVAAASAPPIARTITCVSPASNARISATVPSVLSTPRVFFRANGERTEYYVDMHRTAGNQNEWFAILPAIEPTTKSITYRVAAVDDNKNWVVSAPITINASASCAAAAALTSDERTMANGIVLGLTMAGQAEVPPGFSCRGITNVIGVDCKMRPADACRRLLAAATAPKPIPVAAATPAVIGSGLSPRTLATLAAIGLLLGIGIYSSQNNKNASPSRP